MKLIFPERALSDNFLCFTTTRTGGVSNVPYNSLNLAEHVSDVYEHVSENRKRLFDFLINHPLSGDKVFSEDFFNSNKKTAKHASSRTTVAPLKFLNQTHSSVLTYYSDMGIDQTAADAVYTDQSRVPLAVLTADCLPIILSSKVGNEYAAVHAGWRGLIDGVIENTCDAFTACKGDISAWIGPSICQNHFEVGDEVASQFSSYEFAIINGALSNKFHIDLSAVATQILHQLGVEDVQQSRFCTYCRNDLFSFRQAMHDGFQECGRMATVVIKY